MVKSGVCRKGLHIAVIYFYKMSRKGKSINRKQISDCLALVIGGALTAYGQKGSFRGDGNVLKLDCGGVCTAP